MHHEDLLDREASHHPQTILHHTFPGLALITLAAVCGAPAHPPMVWYQYNALLG